MIDYGVKPNVVTYSTLVTVCKMGKDGKYWKEAIELIQEMHAVGIVPNAVTYASAIHTCGRAGQWVSVTWGKAR